MLRGISIECIPNSVTNTVSVSFFLAHPVLQEASRPDSSANYNWFLVTKKFSKSVQTLLKITHLASYLIIICPNSHEQLTKIKIRSSWSRFEHCSESLI